MALTNSEIKFIKSLQLKKNRRESGLFIVEGVKLVNELLNQNVFTPKAIYSSSESLEIKSEFKLISPKELSRISGLKSPNDVLAVVEIPKIVDIEPRTETVLILDEINDPGNLGTIIRTADWFGVDTIYLTENSVDAYNPKTVQSTMGSLFRVKVITQTSEKIVELLKQHEYKLIGAEMDGINLYEFKKPNKIALIMGSESHGINSLLKSSLSQSITIPRKGNAESLNVSMACGIILSELNR